MNKIEKSKFNICHYFSNDFPLDMPIFKSIFGFLSKEKNLIEIKSNQLKSSI